MHSKIFKTDMNEPYGGMIISINNSLGSLRIKEGQLVLITLTFGLNIIRDHNNRTKPQILLAQTLKISTGTLIWCCRYITIIFNRLSLNSCNSHNLEAND